MLPPDPKKMATQPPDVTPDRVAVADPAAAAAPPPPPAVVTAPPGLGTMLHALRRCWWWALPTAAVAGVLAFFASLYVYPGAYTSTVMFRILVTAGPGTQEEEGAFSNVQRAYKTQLLSHTVLDEAIRKSQVADKYGVNYTPQTLAKKLTVTFLEGPEEMTVTLSGDDPESVADVLNALGEVYPRKVEQTEKDRLRARIALLRRRLDASDRRDPGRALTLAEQLYDKRQELAKAEKDAGIDDTSPLKSKQEAAQVALARTREKLSESKRALVSQEAKRQAIERTPPRAVERAVNESDVKEALSRNGDYVQARKDIKELNEHLDIAREAYGGTQLAKIEAKIQARIDDRVAERREIAAEVRAGLRQKQRDLAADEQRKLDADHAEKVAAARAVEAGMHKDVEALEDEVRQATRKAEEAQAGGPRVPPEVEALRDQVRQLTKEQDTIGTEIAGLEQQMAQPSRVRLHAEAFVPQERDVSRSQKVAIAVGVLVCLGLVSGLCLWEATGRRVYSSGDVLTGLGMRIIGTLPRLPASARKKTASAQALGGLDTRYGMNEAVDAIRTVIMHSPRNDGARVVLISSATGGEGKTTLASHLAASLARAWRKTLLIDGDLRKPALHGQFDLPLEPGFSEALRGEIEFDDAIKPTMTSRLWLMPAGKVDGHSLQALAQEALSNVFEQLKEQYDFIVIDTSPVLLVPDGLLLAQHSDTVLLSVMRDHSRIPAVYAAQQKLASLGIAVLGGVMIGEKTEAYGHAVPYPSKQ
jgi:capsular exopolysaccharide synthesis family protein